MLCAPPPAVLSAVKLGCPVARLVEVTGDGHAGLVRGDYASRAPGGAVEVVRVMERPEAVQDVRPAERNVQDLPAELGVRVPVVLTSDPGAALVPAPVLGTEFRHAPCFFPYLLDHFLAESHGVRSFRSGYATRTNRAKLSHGISGAGAGATSGGGDGISGSGCGGASGPGAGTSTGGCSDGNSGAGAGISGSGRGTPPAAEAGRETTTLIVCIPVIAFVCCS